MSLPLIWKKRIPRIALVLLIFSLFQAFYQVHWDFSEFHPGEFLKTVYTSSIIVPYWYLYACLGLLIILPLLRRMAQNMTEREFLYLFVLYNVFYGVIPVAQYVLSSGAMTLNPDISLGIVTSRVIFYPLMGYWLSRRKDISWRTIGILWGCVVLALAVTCGATHYHLQLTGKLTEENSSKFYKAFHAIPAVALFLTAKKLEGTLQRLPDWGRRLLLNFGSCTFGIYLLEQFLRLEMLPIRDSMADFLPDMLATGFYVCLVVAVGWGITWVLKKVPGLKKLL